MVKVIILKPRLDVMFKQGPVPEARGLIPDIRLPWAAFVHKLVEYHQKIMHSVEVIELPLWMFSTDDFKAKLSEIEYDIIYVPHKEQHSYPITNGRARYYMQSVFSWMFYCDSIGWAGGLSNWPCEDFITNGKPNSKFYNFVRTRVMNNGSKFDQPQINNKLVLPEKYALFACQIPHDETIKYHSEFTVANALDYTCRLTQGNLPLIIKGHPINPDSMSELRKIVHKYHHTIWIDNVSIIQLIRNSEFLVSVNSGTGMEALLLQKPVVSFGRADYSAVSNHPMALLNMDPKYDDDRVQRFFDGWYNSCIDTTDINSYDKLSNYQ